MRRPTWQSRWRTLVLGLVGWLSLALHASAADWSPDGRWLSYALRAAPASDLLKPGWLLAGLDPAVSASPAPGPWRLWATRAGDGRSLILANAQGPIGPPAWSPDGGALAYVRSGLDPNARSVTELVIQAAPDQQRVLQRAVGSAAPGRLGLGHGDVLAWSPDGRRLAAPSLEAVGLQVLDAQQGDVLAEWADAHSPSWSPDGQRLAFFREGDRPGLWLWEGAGMPARRLAESIACDRMPAPVWDRQGQSVWHAVAAGLASRPAHPPQPAARGSQWQLRLIRTSVATGQAEAVLTLPHPRLNRLDDLQAVALALDPAGVELFSSVSVAGEPTVITWSRIASGETLKRFHPVHESIPIRALRLAPAAAEHRLLIELGNDDRPIPPLLCNPTDETCLPLVPDEAGQAVWSQLLLEAMEDASSASPPGDGSAPRSGRPTRLPLPGEFESEHPTLLRLRRLARLGRTSGAHPEPSVATSAERTPGLEEAQFVFDLLLESPDVARQRLESNPDLAPADTPQQRLRRLGLLAQLLLAEGNLARAGAVLDSLRTRLAVPLSLVQSDALGTPWVELLETQDDWIEALSDRLQAMRSPAAADAEAQTTLDLSGTPGLEPQPGAGEAGGFPLRLEPADGQAMPRPPRPGLPAPEPE